MRILFSLREPVSLTSVHPSTQFSTSKQYAPYSLHLQYGYTPSGRITPHPPPAGDRALPGGPLAHLPAPEGRDAAGPLQDHHADRRANLRGLHALHPRGDAGRAGAAVVLLDGHAQHHGTVSRRSLGTDRLEPFTFSFLF